MDCPICKVALSIADRQGIEIDFCPQCRGVWLDRGELDKILERSASYGANAARQTDGEIDQRRRLRRDEDDDDRWTEERRRKRGFLGELFDFD